ncbi:MAG: DNA-deoxyinosine glycosylase [Bacillales bacterium]|nr:DNA-deoxyinosine glycosylase [Bacillales bacterium]
MKQLEYIHATHTLKPLLYKTTEILILGSFPSVKSRENDFYYMHKQNRFWKVIGSLLNEDLSQASIEERTNCLKKYRIGLYDVIEECDIIGSSDLKIRNVVPADINRIIKELPIKLIIINGSKAYSLFSKYFPTLRAIKMPSTSPANASYSLDDLIDRWSELKKYIKE